MKRQLEFKIYGKVQGVGFRASAKRKAEKLNLTGWVRNNDDETVAVIAQGKKRNLEKLLSWAKIGPSLAQVDDIEMGWQDIEKKFEDFSINY